MSRRYLILLLALLLLAVLASWLWWVRPKQVDMATYAPADSLVYLEANNPLDVVETLARTDAWRIVESVAGSASTPPGSYWFQRFVRWTGIGPIQSVILARAQVAAVVTDLGTVEQGDTLQVKPEGALLIETHTSERRIRPPFEQALKTLAQKTYGKPTSRRITTDGVELIEWISPDGSRQIVGAIFGSLIIVGNSEHAVGSCLAVSMGRRPGLKGDSELQQMRSQIDEAHALTFGYVPRGNSGRLLGVGLPLLLGHAPADSDFQRLIINGAAKVFGSLGWTSRAYLTGIEDRYLITLQPAIIAHLKPTFVSAGAKSEMRRVLGNDAYSITAYRFADPAAAWQSLNASVSSQVDMLSAIIFSSLLKSALLSYGIDDPEAFLTAVGGELLTLRLDENAERSIVIASVRNRATLRQMVTKKFGMKPTETAGDSENFADSQGEFAASFVNDLVVIGAQPDVRRFAETIRADNSGSNADRLRKVTFFASPHATDNIVTYTYDGDRVRSFILALIAAKGTQPPPFMRLDESLAALPYSVTETSLDDRGIERSTRSPLGQFSTLLSLLVPEKPEPVKPGL
jgi:hypothetical protein